MKVTINQLILQSRQWIWNKKIYIFGVPIGVFGFLALRILRYRYGHALYAALFQSFGVINTRMLISVIVMTAGAGAAVFKQKNQTWYGLVEWVFGICAGFAIAFTMSPTKPLSTQWITLIGCVYVIARGFNNMIESEQKKVKAVQDTRTSAASHT
jgi:hypothetical protein